MCQVLGTQYVLGKHWFPTLPPPTHHLPLSRSLDTTSMVLWLQLLSPIPLLCLSTPPLVTGLPGFSVSSPGGNGRVGVGTGEGGIWLF